MEAVAENRSELGDRLGQGFVRNRVQGEAIECSTNGLSTGSKLPYTDREKSTTQIDYECRLVDDRVPADRERVPPHH